MEIDNLKNDSEPSNEEAKDNLNNKNDINDAEEEKKQETGSVESKNTDGDISTIDYENKNDASDDAVAADESIDSPTKGEQTPENVTFSPAYSLADAEELRDIFVSDDDRAESEPERDGDDTSEDSNVPCPDNDEKKPFKADGIFEFVELFVMTVAVVMLVLSFVCRHSIVEGDSMQNTLQNGEHLIISDLFYKPKQFDIIVFEDRSTGFSKPMIKRVIATEGDLVEINELCEVRVNGTLLEDEYILIDGPYNQRKIKYTVPDGKVFVMGDHRNESSDSRSFGAIDEDTILGKVVLRFSPLDKFGFVN